MKPAAHIQASIEILAELHEAWRTNRQLPVDALLASYFKSRRYIGSKDRGAISDRVYFTLRYHGSLAWHIAQAKGEATARMLVLASVLFQGTSGAEIATLFSGEKYAPAPLDNDEKRVMDWLNGREFLTGRMPHAARFNYPQWAEGRLKEAFGSYLPTAMDGLNEQAPVDLRANLLKCVDREFLIKALKRDGYEAVPTPLSPIGVRLKKRLPAFTTQSFKDGLFEMQDEGSQIVAQLVTAKPGDKVIDFCAGAGGKTLAIAAAMKNKGRILAWDTSKKRLDQMGKRLARAGVSNVMSHVLTDERDPFTKRHVNSAQWVVVDAPCSGSGTWRRNPDLKWRFTLNDLNEVKAIQQRILDSASRLVSAGGRLVYITCSLFPDENFWQVKQFLEHNPIFKVATPPAIWNKHCIAHQGIGPCVVLTPHKDGTDGFFAAILEKAG